MKRKLFIFSLIALLMLSLSGCSSSSGIPGLKPHIMGSDQNNSYRAQKTVCPLCNGTGWQQSQYFDGMNWQWQYSGCGGCGGSGYVTY